jgi:hypothetical protein
MLCFHAHGGIRLHVLIGMRGYAWACLAKHWGVYDVAASFAGCWVHGQSSAQQRSRKLSSSHAMHAAMRSQATSMAPALPSWGSALGQGGGWRSWQRGCATGEGAFEWVGEVDGAEWEGAGGCGGYRYVWVTRTRVCMGMYG